jgi:hypothetical protein
MPHDEPLPHGRHPSEPASQKLYLDLHRKYIVALQEKRNTFGMRESSQASAHVGHLLPIP